MQRGQRLDAAAWAAFGVVVLVAAWRVDRLENLGINPWSVPGLLPGMVGVLMILFAVVLALRPPPAAQPASAADASADGSGAAVAPTDGEAGTAVPREGAGGMRRAFAAALPCVLFALLAPATGLAFAVDAAIYVAVFIGFFSWPRWRAQGRMLRGLLATLAIAVVAAVVISWLFESVFLVRLP